MNLAKKYKQLFEGKARSNDSNLLKENTLVDAALKAADKMSYDQLEKVISIEDGSVSGMDRDANGTIKIEGAAFNWELTTDDGMTSISLEGEDLENDGPLYEPILGVVDYEYELEEEDDYSDDW